MAIPAQPCACSPYSNICCCGTQNGITVVQPQCQVIPTGEVVNNPAFVLDLNTSYWTYKFLTDCNSTTRGISGIGIPICAEINAANIIVEEKIDGCGTFTVVSFELIKNDPNFGPAPDGFQFLKIVTDDRFDKGVCVQYRIGITGNYPEDTKPISVKAATVVYTFGCSMCFIVPGCVPDGKLLLSKHCDTVVNNNQATIEYTVNVDNVGEGSLDLVEFQDTIFIPSPLTIGTVTVTPSDLTVDTSVSGQIKISGNLGTIEPGGRVTVTYSIPITSIASPGSYTIDNIARAAANNTESSDMCATSLDVIKLTADKCCSTNGSTGTFTITVSSVGNSPDVTVDIFDQMIIPSGVTVLFESFNGCEAYYAGTQTPIPLNVNLDGQIIIDIICRNAFIPFGGSFIKSISYTLISSSVVGIATIINTLTNVMPLNLENIIYEGTENLPSAASIDVELLQGCATPCSQG